MNFETPIHAEKKKKKKKNELAISNKFGNYLFIIIVVQYLRRKTWLT